MKKYLVFYFLLPMMAFGQLSVDSLRQVCEDQNLPDTLRYDALGRLTFHYIARQPDSALYFNDQYFALAIARGDSSALAQPLVQKGIYFTNLGEYESALELYNRSLRIKRDLNDQEGIAGVLTNIGMLYEFQGDYDQALSFYHQSLSLAEECCQPTDVFRSLMNIGNIHNNQGEYDQSIEYYQRSLGIAVDLPDSAFKAKVLNNIGLTYFYRGDYDQALEYYNRSLKVKESIGYKKGMAMSLGNIAGIYLKQGNFARSLEEYKRCLSIFQSLGSEPHIATVLASIGKVYQLQGDYDQSLDYVEQSLAIQEATGNLAGSAGTLNQVSTLYKLQGNFPQALDYAQQSLKSWENIGGKLGVATTLINIGSIYQRQGDYPKALEHCERSLKLFESLGDQTGIGGALAQLSSLYLNLKNYTQAQLFGEKAIRHLQATGAAGELKEAANVLYEVYKRKGLDSEALRMYELHISMRDSLNSVENQRAIIRYDYEKQALADSIEFAKTAEIKDLEISRQRTGLLGTGVAIFLLLLLALSIFRSKRRSDQLLLNILPAETAAELKATGSAAAKEYEQVSVLFSDFIGFTQLSEQLTAAELVSEIDTCFKAFDDIITRYGLEKIKTIGDAYMAVGGLPDPLSASPKDVVLAGLAMQQFIEERKTKRESRGLPFFEMRLGIHTGPVVAGVVGVKKFQYDVWGDTVNTASRMESNGQVGQVNVSAKTFELLQFDPELSFEERGTIEAKGKGLLEMYFVSLVSSAF